MLVAAIFNNLPEMILSAAWTGLVFYTGYRTGKWRARRRYA